MITGRIFAMAGCLAAMIGQGLAEDKVTNPSPGSDEETAILAVMRAPMETLFGKPISFKVQAIALAKDYAYVLVHPERTPGKPIEEKAWKKVATPCEQDRVDFTVEALLKKTGGKWGFDLPKDGKPSVCADDTIVGEDTLKQRGLPLNMIVVE